MRATGIRNGLGLLLLLGGACRSEAPPPEPARPAPPDRPIPPPACVYFKDLRAFLPAPPAGFSQLKEEGSTGKYGAVSVSEAERVFGEGGGREVGVRIVDSTLSERLGDRIRAAVHDARGRGPEDPTAPILLDGALGFVRYDEGEDHAEANLLVGERFVVAVTSRGFDGTGEVRRMAGELDLAGLSKLR